MSDQGRKEYEAMIAAAKAHGEGVTPRADTEVIEDLRIALFARIIEWHDAKAWLPTEQHETVTAILENLDCGDTITKSGFNHRNWIIAGKPGLPKPPPEIWGPEITVDTGGRCPVGGDEVVQWRLEEGSRWSQHRAGDLSWEWKTRLRRKLADHPGDSYWHGRMEVIPESGKAGLDVRDAVVCKSVARKWGRASTMIFTPGTAFRRWLKGDA